MTALMMALAMAGTADPLALDDEPTYTIKVTVGGV